MNIAIRTPKPIARRRRRSQVRQAAPKALLFVAGAAVAAFGAWFDKRRRRMARDRAASAVRHGADAAARKADHASGVAKGAAHSVRPQPDRDYDDTTLARKVETEIFRPADAPKGSVNVSVHQGVVELRGTVPRDDQATQLVSAAEKVAGVKEVRSLLQTAGGGGR